MPRAPLALVLAAVLAAACQASSTPEPRLALADEVDRVAELLEQDRPCHALDVAEALPLQDEALEAPVRDAVGGFVQDLRETIQCPAPRPSPTSTPSPTTPDTEPPPADGSGDEDDDDDEGEGNGEGNGEGEGNGNGGDDDDARGRPDDPGGGNGRGGGNGPGQGKD